MVEIISEWLESETRAALSFGFGEVQGTAGDRPNYREINYIEFGINERGIWLNARNYNLDPPLELDLCVPAGTEFDVDDREYKNIYNIRKFRDLLEDFLFGYGRSDESALKSESFAIPTSELDEEIRERCLGKYDRGEYSDAVRVAGQILEERIKQESPSGNSSGPGLFKNVFNTNGGKLSFGEQGSEQEGVMFLYSGYYQAIRSPLSHRTPDNSRDRYLDNLDPSMAHGMICFANVLLELLNSNTK